MDGQLFGRLYQRLLEVTTLKRRPREQFCDLAIVATYLWSVLHDRPQGWACHREHWSIETPFDQIPSESQLSRRLKTPGVKKLLDHLLEFLWGRFRRRLTKCVDGRPFVVSVSSKDKTARFGVVSGGRTAKGYKLHVITDTCGVLCAWAVTPLDHGESTVARRLIPRVGEGGYLLADNNYDRNPLYALAGAHGLQLIAPPKPSAKALGKIRHSPYRLRGMELLGKRFGQQLSALRKSGIERFFGNMGWRAGGLSHLPGFVRTITRVRRWVQGKLILEALHYEKTHHLQR